MIFIPPHYICAVTYFISLSGKRVWPLKLWWQKHIGLTASVKNDFAYAFKCAKLEIFVCKLFVFAVQFVLISGKSSFLLVITFSHTTDHFKPVLDSNDEKLCVFSTENSKQWWAIWIRFTEWEVLILSFYFIAFCYLYYSKVYRKVQLQKYFSAQGHPFTFVRIVYIRFSYCNDGLIIVQIICNEGMLLTGNSYISSVNTFYSLDIKLLSVQSVKLFSAQLCTDSCTVIRWCKLINSFNLCLWKGSDF